MGIPWLIRGFTFTVNVAFFELGFMPQHNPLAQIIGYTVPFILMASCGMFCGAFFKRWGVNGMYLLGAVSAVVSGGLVVIASTLHLWSAVGYWFAAQSPVALLAGWPLLVAVALAALGFLTIRRATP